MERLALFLAVGGILLQLCYGQQEAFLQKQLPLRVLVTTPSELSSDAAEAQAVTLTGRQAITVSCPHTFCSSRQPAACLASSVLSSQAAQGTRASQVPVPAAVPLNYCLVSGRSLAPSHITCTCTQYHSTTVCSARTMHARTPSPLLASQLMQRHGSVCRWWGATVQVLRWSIPRPLSTCFCLFACPQAVFNRPVIALGSDWGSEQLPANLVSLQILCS